VTLAFAVPATAQDVWLQAYFGPPSVPRDTGTVSYTLLVNNNSAVVMPANTILVRAEAVQVNPNANVAITMCGNTTNNEASCLLNSNLLPGASWNFASITLQAPGSIFPTAIEVRFSVSRAGDPNPLNDSISVTVPFNRSATDLATGLDPATRTVTVGDTVGYTLTTTAQGEDTAAVIATVETPPGVALANVSDPDCTIQSGGWNGLRCDLGSSASRSITFDATFNEAGPAVTLRSGISSGSNSDPNAANDQASSVVTVEPRSQIGGTVTGLAGSGLVLQNNGVDNLAITANGAFTFPTALANGSSYDVTVATQPGNPSQTCTVSNGSGTVAGANVTNIAITCTTNTYTVGGTVSGLAGSGLVLRNNGGNDLAINANGAFTFTTALADGSAYAVTVATQPGSPSQTCTVSNGSGSLASANVTNVAITCATNTYTVGGTVSGLAGSGLVLRNNGGNDLAIGANGAFTFATALADGSAYAVAVAAQPASPSQTCTVSNGSGSLAGANVTTVSVACETNPPVINLSTAELSFGNVNVSDSATATVTIGNTGSGDLLISQFIPPQAPFSITGGSCGASPRMLAAGASCTVVLGFAPASGGLFSGMFTIVSNAPSSPHTIVLSGGGFAAAVMVPTLELTGLWLLVLGVALFGALGLRRVS